METYLDELVLIVQRVSPVIAGVGITLRRDHEMLSVAVSNPLAGVMDEVQYKLDQGPCLQALSTGEVVSIDDVATEERFGSYTSHALAHGVLSSLSVPLLVAGASVGALNSYSRETHAFGDTVRAELITLAAQAQVSLALTLRAAQQSSIVDQLHTAMQTRSTIDQALGIVMTRQRCTATEAFAVLRSVSQSSNRKIVDIATELITTSTGSSPQAGRFEM
ncbi:GAF and ANTAR domain-containing protein [Kineococcus sp. NBC_00420]|uniref:GAF and ANTAR domain-containing protein n=1 Tax=Kineococcus sp. NBC_00420 TaxID=2903564 RepID=UPI002E21CB9F